MIKNSPACRAEFKAESRLLLPTIRIERIAFDETNGDGRIIWRIDDVDTNNMDRQQQFDNIFKSTRFYAYLNTDK